jgi:CheY-like chemotaxis protein
MSKITIMYVEDSFEETEIMKLFCKQYVDKVRLFTFPNGIEFLNFLEKEDREKISGPTCILLDIDLPFLNGLQILQKLKENQNSIIRTLPVVMYSSSTREQDRKTSQALGANAHIEKPLTGEGTKTFLDFLIVNTLQLNEKLGLNNFAWKI